VNVHNSAYVAWLQFLVTVAKNRFGQNYLFVLFEH